MIKFRVKLDVFNQEVTVIYGTFKDFNKYFPTSPVTEERFNHSYGIYAATSEYYAIGFNEELTRSDHIVSTISHEVMHITHLILDAAEINLTGPTNEVYAYMVGYLVGEITKKIGDFKIKKTKKKGGRKNGKV